MSDSAPATPDAPAIDEGWKLKKETLPPGFLTFELFRAKQPKTINRSQHEVLYWRFLFDRETGLYGNRPGNPWRMSRRKWIERFIVIQDKQTGQMIHMRLNEAQRLLEAEVIHLERKGEPVRLNILKARQHGTCFAPWTRVLTADMRWVPIDSVRVGDELVSVDEHIPGGRGKTRKMRRAVVEAKAELVHETLALVTDKGTLVLTPEHRLMMRRRGADECIWVEAGKMKVGDKLRMLSEPWEAGGSMEDGWMGGMIDGEGSLRSRGRPGLQLGVSQLPGAVYDRVVAYLRVRGYRCDDRAEASGSGLGRKVSCASIYRIDDVMRLVGQTRPTRFTGGSWWEGKTLPGKSIGAPMATIVRIERRGPQRVIDLQTSTKTFIAEGIVSHNSTYVAAFKVWMDLTMPHTRGLLMGHKKSSATVIHGRIDSMMAEIRHKDGKRWQFIFRTNNRNEIVLERPIDATTLVDSAEAPDYRGDTLRFFHAIEPAEWPNAEQKANAVTKCVPKAPFTYVFVEGTARGETGWFADTWKAAWKAQQYGEANLGASRAVFYPWYLHQKYRWSTVYGRELPEKTRKEIDGTLSEEERTLLDTTYIRRGVGRVTIDHDQLAWRRMVIADECQGSVEFFHQEYPSTPDEAFLSTGLRFFSSKALQEMRQRFVRQPKWRGDTIDPEGEAKMMQSLPSMEAVE